MTNSENKDNNNVLAFPDTEELKKINIWDSQDKNTFEAKAANVDRFLISAFNELCQKQVNGELDSAMQLLEPYVINALSQKANKKICEKSLQDKIALTRLFSVMAAYSLGRLHWFINPSVSLIPRTEEKFSHRDPEFTHVEIKEAKIGTMLGLITDSLAMFNLRLEKDEIEITGFAVEHLTDLLDVIESSAKKLKHTLKLHAERAEKRLKNDKD